MYAECLNETGNKTSEAVNLINTTIRIRAFGGAVPAGLAWNPGRPGYFSYQYHDERMRSCVLKLAAQRPDPYRQIL